MMLNKGVTLLGVSAVVLTMGTASLGQVPTTQTTAENGLGGVDIEAIAMKFEKQAEYLDSIRYGVPSSVSLGEIALPLAASGREAVSSQIKDAELELKENIQQNVGVSSTDLAFDSFKVNSSDPNMIQADLKYYATRIVEDGVDSSTWKEEVIYGVEIDPKTGKITDLINKDTDWVNDNIPDEEIVVNDGLGSGEEGLSSEEMRDLDQRSALRASDSIMPVGMDY